MTRGLIVGAVAIFATVLALDGSVDGKDKEPASIKVVMKQAMKGGLCGKVAEGKASDEEKKQLISLLTDLAASKCPKGDEKDWKERTSALLAAAKADDAKALAKASDCKACHSLHKK